MKREIKFRGIAVEDGKFVFGYLTPFRGSDYRIKEIFCIHSGILEVYEIVPNTECQFTGLTDKNGVEIYEGDVIKVYVKPSKGKNYDRIEIVSWIDSCQDDEYDYIRSGFEINNNGEIEVIGNIHQNPELLSK